MSDARNEESYRRIAKRSPASEEQGTFAEHLRRIMDATKWGTPRLATALGVPRWTVRRWLAGEGTKTEQARSRQQLALRVVIRLERRARLVPTREAWLRARRKVTVLVQQRYVRSGRKAEAPRSLTFDERSSNQSLRLAAGAVSRAVDAFLAGAEWRDGPEYQNSGIFAPIVDSMLDSGPGGYQEMFRDEESDGLSFDVLKVRFH